MPTSKPTPKPSPSTYEQMLSKMENLFDTAETKSDLAEAKAYQKMLQKKFPNGAPKPVKSGKPATGVDAKRRALKAVRDKVADPRKNPANYDQNGNYGFDGSNNIDPKSPRG